MSEYLHVSVNEPDSTQGHRECANAINHLLVLVGQGPSFINVNLVEQADTPYQMVVSDQFLAVKPNDASTVQVTLIPGVEGRVIQIKNVKTGAAATVAIYSDSGDLLQLSPGTDPTTTGPYNLTKGQQVDFVYLSDFGAWGIL